jgi:hypothetical protein
MAAAKFIGAGLAAIGLIGAGEQYTYALIDVLAKNCITQYQQRL